MKSTNFLQSVTLLLLCLFFISVQKGTAQIKWDFDEDTAGTASPVASSIPSDVLSVSDFSFVNSLGTVASMVTKTSPSTGYTGASGAYNATTSAVGGAFSADSSTYFTFTITPDTGYAVSLSAIQFGARSIGAGPNAFQVYTSADNYTTSITAGSLINNSTWALKQPTIAKAVVGAINTPLTIRVYGYSGVKPTSGSANWRIDDVSVTASPIILPIVLQSFSLATEAGSKGILLRWQTSLETNVNSFTIERSANENDFVSIGEVAATNNHSGSTYQYADNTAVKGTVFYRLKMVDKDGSYKYSNILAATAKESLSISAYPNPTSTDRITLVHPKAQDGAVIKIVGINGAVLMTYQVSKDAVQSGLGLQGIAKGKYVIVFDNGTGKNAIQFDRQ